MPISREAHHSLIDAIQQYDRGNLVEALACCRRVLADDPHESAAHHLIGLIALDTGHVKDAEESLRSALACDSQDPDVWNDLGNVLQLQGKVPEAANAFRNALRLAPDFADAHSNYGYMLYRQRNFAESLASFRRAIEIDPTFTLAYNNLGCALMELGSFQSAADAFQEAIEVAPNDTDAYVNLGRCLRRLDQSAEAASILHRGLQIAPERAELWLNFSGALKDLSRLDESEIACERAIALRPNYPEAHWNLSLLLLAQGRWRRGWDEFEWRRKIPSLKVVGGLPELIEWRGQDLTGKSILLLAEQGLGDTFHFIRFAHALKEQGAEVVAAVQPELIEILKSCTAVERLVPLGSALPRCDYFCPLMSLPRLLCADVEQLRMPSTYLSASSTLVDYWRERLRDVRGLRIGIAWQGNPHHASDRHRSFPLHCFEPIARLPDVRLISLQKGAGTEQIEPLQERVPLIDLGPEIDGVHGAFMDTAAILKNLDLVICCDTALVHLAGAIGAPVWMPTNLVPDWRWQLQGTDSAWYPQLRLFRQSVPGEWAAVFETIATELVAKRTTQKSIQHSLTNHLNVGVPPIAIPAGAP